MYKTMIVLFTLLHTRNSAIIGSRHQYFISTPANLTVNSGSHARLSCRVGNLVGTCEWTRDGFSLGTDRNLGGYSRYLMPGQRQDICDLSIDPVLPIDEGLYQCQVSGGHGVPPIASSPVSLSVNSEPGKPYIMQAMEEEMMEVQEGEEVELQCESQGGRPPAEIQWWDGEGRRIISGVTEHVRKMEARKTLKTISKLKFHYKESISIKCTASSDAFPVSKESKYLIISNDNDELESRTLKEGESLSIECAPEVSKFPKFKWFINEMEINNENSRVLEIEEFVAAYDKAVVKCIGENGHGNSEVLKSVKLIHEDSKVEKSLLSPVTEGQKRGKKNKKTVITCIAEEQDVQNPTYVWKKGKLVKTMKNIENEETRKIKCDVIPDGYLEFKQMKNKINDVAKVLKNLSQNLNQIVTPND